MKLLLLRHAKSSYSDGKLSDHDRPLNPRGERAATLMGVWLAQAKLLPDLVLCSSSLRTRQTYERLCVGLGDRPELLVREDLYLASPGAILEAIREAPDGARRLVVIGHNPGIEDLTRRLAPDGEAGALERAAGGMGTAHLAEIRVEGAGWNAVAPGSGWLERLVRPKELV